MNTPQNPQLHKHIVINCFYLWFIRNFKVISNQKAKELGLRHWRGVYGDEINRMNCRSIWFDSKQRQYRVSHLEDVS
jgi:hypothetical protein